MRQVTRRSFIGTMGMMGAIGAMAIGNTGISIARAEVEDYRDTSLPWSGSTATLEGCPWDGTPENIQKLGGSTMPLDELNHRRQMYVDSQTEYTCADGTVIPEVYVKLYALINTYSTGCGNIPNDLTFTHMMELLNEEQAQAMLDMPMGVWFRPFNLYEKGGRTLEECERICEEIRAIGYLPASDRPNGTFYHHPALGGLGGYLMDDEQFAKSKESDGNFSCLPMGDTYFHDFMNSGTPYYYPVPCDKSVVDTGEVLPCDDYEAKLRSHKHFAVAPCACRYFVTVAEEENYPTLADFATGELTEYTHEIEGEDMWIETCLFTGEEAMYWVELGVAREIDLEEALSIIKRSVESGYVVEPYFQKDSACICQCKSDACVSLGMWRGFFMDGTIEEYNSYQQLSHYVLNVDFDKCIKCGTCANRCPLHAIEMTGEDGAPQITGLCMRCGQCAYVCPMEARKLSLRPEEELLLPLPETVADDWNAKAAFRFEQGFVY